MSGNELQDDEVIEPALQEIDQDIEQREEGSDLATETQAEKKTVEFDEKQQEVFNKAIGKKTFELRETERKLEAERAERLRIEAELSKLRAPVVEVPPMPDDPFSETYQRDLENWKQTVALKAANDAHNELLRQAQLAREQQEEARKQEELNKKAAEFTKSADKFGIKNDELMNAINIIGSYRLGDQFANMLLSDEHGALISTYLANSYEDLETIAELNRTSPYSVGAYIERVVKPKAQARKPKVSNAPDPTPVVKGNGAPESKSPLLKGVTYR